MTWDDITARAIEHLWTITEPTVFIDKEMFLAGLDGWAIESVEHPDGPGGLHGVFMTKGSELHFSIFEPKIHISMKLIRPRLLAVMEEHGHVVTRTPRTAERQHRFNKRMGFVAIREDEFYIYYRLDKING